MKHNLYPILAVFCTAVLLITTTVPVTHASSSCEMPGDWVGNLEYWNNGNTWQIEVDTNDPNGGFVLSYNQFNGNWTGFVYPHHDQTVFNLFDLSFAIINDMPATCYDSSDPQLHAWKSQLHAWDNTLDCTYVTTCW